MGTMCNKLKGWLSLAITATFLLISSEVAAASSIINSYCKDVNYKCVVVKGGQTWQSMFPNPTQRDIVMRLNRMNTQPWGGMVIAVPKNLKNITALDVSPMPQFITPQGVKTIIVKPYLLAWGAYDPDGNLVHWGAMSGGKGWCSDIGKSCNTVQGKFMIYDKRGAGCKSSKFPVGRGGAPMPYCMFFHGGYALHASTSVPGHNASHGCVRIFLNDSQWLNQVFVNMPSSPFGGTVVIVEGYANGDKKGDY